MGQFWLSQRYLNKLLHSFLNNYNEDNINIRHEKAFCDTTYLGDSFQEVGRNNGHRMELLDLGGGFPANDLNQD